VAIVVPFNATFHEDVKCTVLNDTINYNEMSDNMSKVDSETNKEEKRLVVIDVIVETVFIVGKTL